MEPDFHFERLDKYKSISKEDIFMKKIILASAIIVTFGSSSVFAHHPAADIVDPDIYAMIDENVADTPHADLDLTDMGSDSAAGAGGDMGAQVAVNDIESPATQGPRR